MIELAFLEQLRLVVLASFLIHINGIMLGEYQDNQDNDGGISSNQQEQEAGGPLTPDT